MADQVKFKKGSSTNLDNLPVESGSLIYTTDNNKLFIDTDSRHEIGESSNSGVKAYWLTNLSNNDQNTSTFYRSPWTVEFNSTGVGPVVGSKNQTLFSLPATTTQIYYKWQMSWGSTSRVPYITVQLWDESGNILYNHGSIWSTSSWDQNAEIQNSTYGGIITVPAGTILSLAYKAPTYVDFVCFENFYIWCLN